MSAISYVANASSNTVSVVDTGADAVLSTIAVGTSPNSVAFSPDGTKAYVVNAGNKTVSVIAVSTASVTSTITVGNTPYSVAFSPDGTKAYVTNFSSNTISVIAVATNTVTKSVSVGTGPYSVAFSPDGTKAYVANFTSSSVSVIAVATDTVAKTVSVAGGPVSVAFSPDGTKAYVALNTAKAVSVLTVSTDTVAKTVGFGGNLNAVAFSPDGTKAYVTSGVTKTVYVLTVSTDTLAKSVPITAGALAVAFSPNGTKAYVTSNSSAIVTVMAVSTDTVTNTLAVGNGPSAVAFLSARPASIILSFGCLASCVAQKKIGRSVSFSCTAATVATKVRGVLILFSATATPSIKKIRVRLLTITAAARGFVSVSSPQLTLAQWLAQSYTDLFVAVRTWRTAWFIHRGSPMISPTALLHYLDLIAANVLTADYQAAANALAGDGTDVKPSISRVLVGGDGVSSLVYGSADEQFIIDMGPVTDLYVANADVFAQLTLRHGTLMQKLNDTLSKMGAKVLVGGAPAFNDLDTYATYQNSLAPGSFRVLPQIALLQFIYNARQGSRLMRPANVAAAVTHLGAGAVSQNADGAGGAVAWTPDSSVRLVNDTGAALQGYSAAKGAAVRVTQAITGTLTLTLTALGQDSTGAAASGRTWTAVLDNAAAGSVIPLVPGMAGDRIASVPTATGAGAATAGGFDVVTLTER